LPGGNIGLRLPAPRQAHSPSQYTGMYGYCSSVPVISPPDLCARPGRRCPHFMLKWRYSEVLSWQSQMTQKGPGKSEAFDL
jgi:hypothetical protein